MFEKLKQKIKAIDIFNTKRLKELETANKNLRQTILDKGVDLDWLEVKAVKDAYKLQEEIDELKEERTKIRKNIDVYFEYQKNLSEAQRQAGQKLRQLGLKLQ